MTITTSGDRSDPALCDGGADLQRVVDEHTTALRGANERLKGAIDERKRVEAQLERERDFSDTIIATSGALILVIDRDRRIVRFNAFCERVTGFSAAEVVGKTFDELFLIEEERKGVLGSWNELLTEPVANTFENHWRTRSGELRLIEWQNRSIDAPDGLPLFVVSTGNDVTEQRRGIREIERQRDELAQLTRELRTSNAELEAFSYSVSHDLRAPLRALDGFSQALLEDNAEQLDERGRNYLGRIRAATQRMGQLIDDLLTLSRVSRGRMSAEPVDLSAIAREIIARLRREHPERNVDVVVDEVLTVRGDARLLTVVMENLLSNAWKFTSKTAAPRIAITGTDLPGESQIVVADNGAGFDMEFADKLFTPFQRLHHAADFPGNGVGLATVQRIIRRHGGRVAADAAPRRGATFSFVLPKGRGLEQEPDSSH